ncbi:MAG: ribosomal protein S18-alanine N-acetyltransferase [Proteobacteria bacterium]|nr:ribosomal protein S18-alanine N-acetyltransferase [Pseudomonadota bacterium]
MIDEISAIEQRSYPNPWKKEQLIEEFQKEISFIRALKLVEEIVAYSFSYIVLDELHLLNLTVKPEHRRRGFAKFLLNEMISFAKMANIKTLSLEVRESNIVARNLYREFGFQEVGYRNAYYSDNLEAAILMSLNIINS